MEKEEEGETVYIAFRKDDRIESTSIKDIAEQIALMQKVTTEQMKETPAVAQPRENRAAISKKKLAILKHFGYTLNSKTCLYTKEGNTNVSTEVINRLSDVHVFDMLHDKEKFVKRKVIKDDI